MSFNRKFILKSGSYSTLELLSNQGLGLISFFILVRVMTKDDFGIWVLYMSTTTLLEQARIGFIKNGFIKYLNTGDNDLKGRIFAASIALNFSIFLITAVISCVLAFYVGPVLWSTDVMKPMFLWYIPYSFLLTVSFSLARGKMKLVFSVEKEWMKKLSSFGIYTFGTNLSAMILRNIDQFILGSFQSKVYLALYNTAVRITNLIEIPTNAMSSIVYPKSVSMVHENKTHELKDMYERSVAIIFLFVLPIVIAVFIFPEFFIIIVAGRDYLDAVAYLRITILFALFVPFMRQSGTVLDSMGKPKINFYLTIIAAGVNVISNLLFIHFLGPIGAAYATLVSYTLILTVNQIYIKKFLGIEIRNVFVYIGYYYRSSFSMILKKLRMS